MTAPRTGRAVLVNAVGLHARPAVRLTQLARRFAARVEVALTPEGPWADAKSPVQVLRVRAPQGAVLHVRSEGADAEEALTAVLALVSAGFDPGAGP
jgi:phosphocarrier protein